MKNIWKVIIVALCVVLLAALVAVAVYADEQSENVTKLGSVQVTTSGSVNMKFKYEAIDESIDYFVVEINGDKYKQVPGNVVEESNRTVTVALRPDQMASQVTVYAAIDGDETKYAEKSYSVRDYAMTILNNEDYADYHASMRGLLNWGAMADMYFNQKTFSLINKGIYSDGTNPVNDTESFAHGDVTANQGENINAEGYEVFLNPGDTVMRVYFSYAGSGDMKATISKAGSIVATGGDQAPIIKDPKQEDWYYVNITNLGIAVYDKQYTISVTVDGNDTASSTITVLEYLNVIASTEGNDNNGAARQHLARSMYQFYAQARNIVVEGCAHLTGVHNRYESLVEKVFCSNCFEELREVPTHDVSFEKVVDGSTTTYRYICNCDTCEGELLYQRVINSVVFHADITNVSSTVFDIDKPIDERNQVPVVTEIDKDGLVYTHVETLGNQVQTIIEATDVPAGMVMYVKYRLNNGNTPNGYMHTRITVTTEDGVEHLVSDGRVDNADLVKHHDGWVVGRINVKGNFNAEGLTSGAVAKAVTLTITHFDDLDIAYFIAEPTEDNVNGLPYVYSMGDDYYMHWDTVIGSFRADEWRKINDAHTGGDKQTDPEGGYFNPPAVERDPVYIEEIVVKIPHEIIAEKTEHSDGTTTYTYTCVCENCEGSVVYRKTLNSAVYHADITTVTSTVTEGEGQADVTQEITEDGMLYTHVATHGNYVQTVITAENVPATAVIYVKYRLANGTTPEGYMHSRVSITSADGVEHLISDGKTENTDLVKRHNSDLANDGWVVARVNAKGAFDREGLTAGANAKAYTITITHRDDLDISYIVAEPTEDNVNGLPYVTSMGDDYYLHVSTVLPSYIASQWRLINGTSGVKQNDPFTVPENTRTPIYVEEAPATEVEHEIVSAKKVNSDGTITYTYKCVCESCEGNVVYRKTLKSNVFHADITTITAAVTQGEGEAEVTQEIAEDGMVYTHVATHGNWVTTTISADDVPAGMVMYVKYRLANGGTPEGYMASQVIVTTSDGKDHLVSSGKVENTDLVKNHKGWVVSRINVKGNFTTEGITSGAVVSNVTLTITHKDDLDIAYFIAEAGENNADGLPYVYSMGDDYYLHVSTYLGFYQASQWRLINGTSGVKQNDPFTPPANTRTPVYIEEGDVEHEIVSAKKVNSDGTTTYTYKCVCESCEGSVVYRKTLNSAVYHADITTITAAVTEGDGEAEVSQEIAEDGMVYSHVATHGSYVTTTISAENVPATAVIYVKYRLANGTTPAGYMATNVKITDANGVEHLISDGKVENADLIKRHNSDLNNDGWVVARVNAKGAFDREGLTAGANAKAYTITITHRDDLDIAYIVAEPTEDNVNGLPFVTSMGDDYYLHVSTVLASYIDSQWRLINGTSGVKQNDPFTPPANTRTPVYIEEGVDDSETVVVTDDSPYAPKIQYAVDLDSSVAAVLNNASNVNTFDSGTPLRIDVVYMLKAKKVLFQIVDYYGNTVYSKELQGTIGQKIKLTKVFAEHPTGYFTIKIAGEVVDTYVVTPSLGNRTLTDSPFAMDTGLTQRVSQAHVSSFASAMRLVGVTWVRERMDWNKYQTGDNGDGTYAYDNTYLNEISTKLAQVKGTGLNVLLTFSGSPSWATSLAYSYGGSNVNSSSYIYLGTYGTQLAIYDASYKLAMELANCVDMIEFSNEPDHNSMLDMAEQYASWFKSAALGVVDAGTGMKVSIAGMCSNPNDYEYLPLLLESGIMDYSSIFNYHSHKYEMPAEDTIYDFTSGTSKNPREIATLLEIYGINQPAWISESGMKLPASTPSEDDKIAQAPYLVTSAVQALSMGNDKYFWFIGSRWQESGGDFSSFTSGENASDTPKPYPTIAAYSVLTDMLGEGKYIGELNNLPVNGRGYLFNTGKSVVAVLWMKEGTGTYSFTSGKAVVKTDIMGQQTTLSAGTISIDLTCEPIYLTFNGEAPDYYEDYYYSNEIEKEELSVPVLDDAQHIVITPEFEGFTFSETTHKNGHYITSGTTIKVRVVNHGAKAITGTVSVTIPYFSVSADKSEITVEPHSEGFITLTLTKTGSSKVDDFVKFTGEFTDGEQTLTCSPAVVSVYSDTNSDFNITRTFNSDIKFKTITNNSVLGDFKFTVSGSTDSLSDIVVMVDGEVFTNYTYNSFSKQISMNLSGLDEGIHYVSIGFKTDGGDLELIPRLKIRVGETQFVISNEW